MSNAEAMTEVAAFGRCYAKRNRAKALSLIGTRPGSREEVETYRTLFKGDNQVCLSAGTSVRAPLPYVRGAIAEGLLRSEETLPQNYMLTAPPLQEVRNLGDAARCFAANRRNELSPLLATKPGSKQEYAAVSALMGEFDACLPAGAAMRSDATVIRYRLAEALLRLPR